jgi:hypothetical protein
MGLILKYGIWDLKFLMGGKRSAKGGFRYAQEGQAQFSALSSPTWQAREAGNGAGAP